MTSQTKYCAVFFVAPFIALNIASAQSADVGQIRVDGSSTVFPISEAVAEEFSKVSPKVRVNVAVSGTGGGFKKFALKEIDISNASRPIKDSEIVEAKKNNVSYLQVPVAIDGITVVVNPKNTWASSITFAELRKIWAPGSKIKTWKEVRPEWPDKEIKLYGPGTDSGTFDYFSEVIGGKSGALRSDFVKSEDDNVLVRAVAGEANSMAFFGYAYYIESKDQLKALTIDNVFPDLDTIQKGTYKPLSRPVYIYVNRDSLKKPHIKKFVEFYIKNAGALSKEVGYIPLDPAIYKDALKTL
jgi:phosphate transport system substrate-binding protein